MDNSDRPTLLQLSRLADQNERGLASYGAPHEHQGDDIARNVVFGGQILAQMIVAAAMDHEMREHPAKEVKSIHAIFARAGDYGQPLRYEVDPMHSGRSMASDTVSAMQSDTLISRGLLLWSTDEPDLIRHATAEMPDVPPPHDPGNRPDGKTFPGSETYICYGTDTWNDAEGGKEAVQYVWTRYPQDFEDPVVNQAILSWATDGYLIGTAMLPHPGIHEYQAHRTISTGVVSHTVNFHDRFDVGQWLLLSNTSVWAGRGRTYGRCEVFTQDGNLVATYTQDNIVRGFADRQDHTGDYNRIM